MRTTRREVLSIGAVGLAAASPLGALAPPPKKHSLRIAQLTDMHVQPERGAGEGFSKAIRAAQEHKPDLLLMTGDLVMDVMGSDLDRAEKQLAVYREALKDSADVPVRHCIGNHDVWGWNNLDKYSKEPLFGKKWAQEKFELSAPYYHFDQGGWRIVVLDSTHRNGDGPGYTARLNDDQFGWLEDLLADTPATTPVLVASHIPLFCACAFLDGENETKGDWVVPGSWMHIDFRRIKNLFRKHPNVKTALSGHIHLADRVDYLGVSYFCNGAVSAGWWGGGYQEFKNGYAIVDLFEDGTVDNQYLEYEWEVRP